MLYRRAATFGDCCGQKYVGVAFCDGIGVMSEQMQSAGVDDCQ
jgi:hypothetical protein